jgi:subtilisin family serine protease
MIAMKQLLFLILAPLLALSGTQLVTSAEMLEEAAAPANRQILVLLRQKAAHYHGDDGHEAGYGDASSKASRETTGKRLAKEHGLRFVGFWPMPEIGLDCLILEVPEGQLVSDFIAKIERDNDVEWVEPVETYQSLGADSYNDPLFAAAPAATQWHLAELHRTATGNGVTVGVVDSSIDDAHPDLVGQVQLNRNFVEGRTLGAESHGTGVAGIIAAKANNELGMVGVAPKARLLGLRACWQRGRGSVCDSLSIAKALHFAIEKNVDVLNISLTGPSGKLLARLIDKAITNGSVVVAAVDPGGASGGFPASYKGVVAVADSASAASSFGAYRAPGQSVPTTQPNAKWYMVNGSSYSAAHVSGLFALLIEERGSGKSRPVLVKATDGSGGIDARASLKKATGG